MHGRQAQSFHEKRIRALSSETWSFLNMHFWKEKGLFLEKISNVFKTKFASILTFFGLNFPKDYTFFKHKICMFLKLLCFKEQRIHGAQEIFVSILHRTAEYIYAHYMKKRKKLGFWLQSPLRGSDLFGTMQKCTVLRLPSFRGPRTWTLLVKSQVA